jgi:hypothetical protein
MIYKKFILKFFVFIAVLFALDYSCGYVLEYFFYKQKTGPDYQITNTISAANQDVMIFGNSRAQAHYNDSIISKELSLSCSNAGLTGGYSIFFPSFEIAQVLKRHHPKVIVYEMSPFTLGYWQGDYDRLSVLTPYINKFPDSKELVLMKGNNEQLKILSKTYQFNSRIHQIVLYTLFDKRFKGVKGFIPIKGLTFDVNNCEDNPFSQYIGVDKKKVKMLQNTIDLCKMENVKLIFVNSPFYHSNQIVQSKAYTKTMSILKENNCNYIDMSNDSIFMSKTDLFANQLHLNTQGANLFSQKIAKKLKYIIKN